jgi:hypothetical protein
VIKGLGLSTLAALTGVGSLNYDSNTVEYTMTLPNDWVHRLAPELCAGIGQDLKVADSIIPIVNTTLNI